MENPLIEWMKKSGVSCCGIAAMVKVHQGTVYKWVKGIVSPSARNAIRLYKISNGAVPVSHWGYAILPNGKIKKLNEGPSGAAAI